MVSRHGGEDMSVINLENLKKNKTDIIKCEIGTLLFNLGKTHAGLGIWRKAGFDAGNIKEHCEYTFRKYQGYFKEIEVDNKKIIPFEVDLASASREFSQEFRGFFYETDVKFEDLNEKMKLIDVIKGDQSEKEFIRRIMFRGCENINSGIDKGAPKDQLDSNLYISNAFGHNKGEVLEENFDAQRIKFLKGLWQKIKPTLPEIPDNEKASRVLKGEKIERCKEENKKWNKLREYIMTEVNCWYSNLLSDSRFPVNDVTLWDQVYMTASMFKAALAAICLEKEKYDVYINDPSQVRWSVLGIQYDKLALAEKALNPNFIDWYRKGSKKVDESIKDLIEEKYVLGNEIYRDETGIYFLVPENIVGEKTDNLYKLHIGAKELENEIIKCFELLKGEVFPAIFLTAPSRGTMNLANLIEKAQDNFLQACYPENIEDYIGKENDSSELFRVICDVCRIRLADKKDNLDLSLCEICRNRQKSNERAILDKPGDETIWTSELQDNNGRIVLITVKFELREWLNGNMINTLLVNDEKWMKNDNNGDWAKSKENIKELLNEMKDVYSSVSKKEQYDGYRLEKYYQFQFTKQTEANQDTFLIDHFLRFFDKGGVQEPYTRVMNEIDKHQVSHKKQYLVDLFNRVFYKFLDTELKAMGIDTKALEKRNDSIKQQFGKKANKKDWGESPHNTAAGVFAFAYIEKQIVGILLERSIGDRWERLIEKKLPGKVNFDKRKIYWDKLKDNDIEFLSCLLLQFLIRKNPSPARLYRVWETTQDFFKDIYRSMQHNLNIHPNRPKRIMWKKVIDNETFKKQEFRHQGLEFLSDEEGNIYLISSIDKALPILTYNDKIEDIEIGPDCEFDWKKDSIELEVVKTGGKFTLNLRAPKEYMDYKPYLSIIDPTPISWQFIVPAEYAPKFVNSVKREYNKEFKYVKGKLPLHIGIVTQHYKKPLYMGIKALRNIRRDIDNWEYIEVEVDGDKLKQMHKTDKDIDNNIQNDPSEFYSLYPFQIRNNGEKDNESCYEFYINPEKEMVRIKDAESLNTSNQVKIYPNTIDFEFLDVNTRRNDIYYDHKKGETSLEKTKMRAKRVGRYKQNRPYTWDEWESFDDFRKYFNGEKKTQLHKIITLIYSKLDDWEDEESIKDFMLSSFINVFDLKGNIDNKEKDNYAKLFRKDSWVELEGMSAEDFKRGLFKFLDMYDFWHNALGKI